MRCYGLWSHQNCITVQLNQNANMMEGIDQAVGVVGAAFLLSPTSLFPLILVLGNIFGKVSNIYIFETKLPHLVNADCEADMDDSSQLSIWKRSLSSNRPSFQSRHQSAILWLYIRRTN